MGIHNIDRAWWRLVLFQHDFQPFLFQIRGDLIGNKYDFATGDLLYLATEAEIVWEGEQIKTFDGAQRLLRLHVSAVRYVKSALPLRWVEGGVRLESSR